MKQPTSFNGMMQSSSSKIRGVVCVYMYVCVCGCGVHMCMCGCVYEFGIRVRCICVWVYVCVWVSKCVCVRWECICACRCLDVCVCSIYTTCDKKNLLDRIELEAEIRVQVDELMREELKNLKLVRQSCGAV